MAHRSQAYLTYLARRTRLYRRLVHESRIAETRAERWVAQWEIEGALRGLDKHVETFWDPAWDWIAERRRRWASGQSGGGSVSTD